MKQAELARKAGISVSYMSLVEHNKRQIGGALLIRIAKILGVPPALLSRGVPPPLAARLQDVARRFGAQCSGPRSSRERAAEQRHIDSFATQFPGWAQLIVRLDAQTQHLEQIIAALSDRLTHDPHLASTLHEILTMVTSIRAATSILADSQDISPQWRARFHRNINEDSQRLTEQARQLVAYLERVAGVQAQPASPPAQLDAMLRLAGWHFPTLEGAAQDEQPISQILAQQTHLTNPEARALAQALLVRYQQDAKALPMAALAAALNTAGLDPPRLAQHLGCGLDLVLRRLAAMPAKMLAAPVGLVICDSSGTLIFRKPLEGFGPLIRGGACPKWPLFTALAHPYMPFHTTVALAGYDTTQFECFSISTPIENTPPNQWPLFHAHMLITPARAWVGSALEVGQNCRICPSQGCRARRVPSLLAQELPHEGDSPAAAP
ncbi:MAG: helix-turn-helix domain-containing protein [Rhodobacteraceae bacterium]|nr:helix-turn-helix domain-containing protein [Paracoccaceae bacterium]